MVRLQETQLTHCDRTVGLGVREMKTEQSWEEEVKQDQDYSQLGREQRAGVLGLCEHTESSTVLTWGMLELSDARVTHQSNTSLQD